MKTLASSIHSRLRRVTLSLASLLLFSSALYKQTFNLMINKITIKHFLLAAASLALLSTSAFGQSATIAFDDHSGTADSGSYNPTDTFTLDVNLTLVGFSSTTVVADSVSYFLQSQTALAPYISITSITYFTFTAPNQPNVPKNFTDSSGANAGFLSEKGTSDQGDLGAFSSDGNYLGSGTYKITSLTFTLSGAPVGTYSLLTTTNSPKQSFVGETSFGRPVGGETSFGNVAVERPGTSLPAAAYTITIVPEPSTWALVALGTLGFSGISILRRRQRV